MDSQGLRERGEMSAPRARASIDAESGQVVVEQALVMPMTVFLILGIVQLTMLQHARLATEFAAFSAARAGIVSSGDPKRMEQAALVALIPTYGRADSWGEWNARHLQMDLFQKTVNALTGGLVDMVEVTITSPENDDALFGKYGEHMDRKQIDFDDYRPGAAEFNLLSIEVRYLYEMRVPFANWMLQSIWFAHKVSNLDNWSGHVFLAPQQGAGTTSAMTATDTMALADPDLNPLVMARQQGRYFMPIRTWYTMRMQSNFYRRHL